jgi:mono/diheme cytochrome c family protein
MASKSPDLSLSALSLEKRVALVTYGKGTMPGQKGVLSAPEIQAVARYIERFRE